MQLGSRTSHACWWNRTYNCTNSLVTAVYYRENQRYFKMRETNFSSVCCAQWWWDRLYKPFSILTKRKFSPWVPHGGGTLLKFQLCVTSTTLSGAAAQTSVAPALCSCSDLLFNHIFPIHFWTTCGFELKFKLGFVALAWSLAGIVMVESSIIAKARGSIKILNGHYGMATNQSECMVVLLCPDADQVDVSPDCSYGFLCPILLA